MSSVFEKSTLNLAVIGNCSFNALINKFSRIVWCCMPRFDSPPLFSRLLTGDEGPESETGYFDIVIDEFIKSEQHYIKNTAILETKLFDKRGNILKIIDFAPRFEKSGRFYAPKQFVRILEKEKGTPRIKIRIRPLSNYGQSKPIESFGSNHISYSTLDFRARMTTNIPIDFIEKEIFFLLNKKKTIFFGNDEPFLNDITNTGDDFYTNTYDYWQSFSKALHIPLEWQQEVIRSAITLKMCQVESSGAIVAAMTTSIPEEPKSERNWDYRFCWLRDSYHIIQALNRLGATCTMNNYIAFIANIGAKHSNLQPLYGILMEEKLTEKICKSLKGYRGQGPVRIGNEAYSQIQNDNYGNIILSVILIFYDERMNFNKSLIFKRLEEQGEFAFKNWNVKDAGIWELRNSNHVHTLSSVMCWVSCDRLSKISAKLNLKDKEEYWRIKADIIHKEIYRRAWDEKEQSFMATLFDEKNSKEPREFDASVLLLASFKFVDPLDPKFVKTVKKIEEKLVKNSFCYRYISADDFGVPDNSFIICTFWFIEALHEIGEDKKARKLFKNLLKYRNHVGLLSEDINPETKELWGNFPQAYSMVGIINTAMTLSKSWRSVGF